MATFLIAVEECYNENDGAYDVLHLCNENGVYSRDVLRGNDIEPKLERASAELRVKAALNYQERKIDLCQRNGNMMLIGCTVILKGSRKAPNKTPLSVVDYQESYFDSYYYNKVDAKIAVMVEGKKVWVNASCADVIVSGRAPYWA